MVLGLRSKHKKDGSIQVNYLVHVQDIKPWSSPPQSVDPSQCLSLLWQHGDQMSGFLSPTAINSKIEFNQSFILPLTLQRDKKDRDKFQKNFLEFHLYEPRKDKPNKDRLLGSATINLGDYGVIENVTSVSIPLSSKKSSKSVSQQPTLFLSIQSNDKDETNSSTRSSLSKQSSMDKYGQESPSQVANDNELGIASFTDDEEDDDDDVDDNDKSTHSSYKNDKVPLNNYTTSSKLHERSMTSVRKEVSNPTPFLQSSFSTMNSHNKTGNGSHGVQEHKEVNPQPVITTSFSKPASSTVSLHEKNGNFEATKEDNTLQIESEEKKQFSEDNLVGKFLASRKQDKLRSNTLVSNRKPPGSSSSNTTMSGNKLKHLKSVQIPKSGGISGNGGDKDKDKGVRTNDDLFGTGGLKSETLNGKSEERSRIEMLEEELRETAAIEAGLYSIVAEHGSSTNKVHAPARRLSRLYLHDFVKNLEKRKGNAAKAIVSGLVLVSKSCGNDVPRLTFWLSNSVMLRAIISQQTVKKSSIKLPDDWRDPQTFMIALEKVESWMFSRIIESVWWQTMTPHMQSSSGKMMGLDSKKTSGNNTKKGNLGNQQGNNFSIELWKKAFKDACERLCPTRAGGHECGCLPVLPRLVMEQLVGRLDVAMFNAILRESEEDMPTDPLSDPIGDLRVLPIPSGRSSFGAGAQLKNTIGTWSRWLTDLFGIEDNDAHEDADDVDNKFDTSFKAFRLLHALSDLMMLPFEMLADQSIRKEVCPTFSTPLIRRVVCSFVPDEFSPNPIPNSLIEALDSEIQDEEIEDSESSHIHFPCIAPPSTYTPPPSHSLSGIIGLENGSQSLRRSSSSVLKKSYTSDDELDELDSPLTSIITDGSRVSSSSKGLQWVPKGGRSIVRYQLLREVWKDGE